MPSHRKPGAPSCAALCFERCLLATPANDLFARYAEPMTTENELDASIAGFHLDALSNRE